MLRRLFLFSCLLWLFHIALFSQSKIYYINTDTGIERALLDGSEREVIIPSTEVRPQGIAVDDEEKKIYWTDWVSKKIQRSNFDGSNIEDLITVDLDLPEGISLDLDNNKMYWVDSGSKKVMRSQLDGTTIEVLFSYDRVNLDDVVTYQTR